MSGVLFSQGLGGVIFDCDGVIIDSRAANGEFYNRVLDHFGLPPMTAEQESYSFMATGLQALHYILPEHLHSEIDRVTSEVINYQRDIFPLLRLMPGFREFVDEMHGMGLRLAIATNRTEQGIQRVLDFFSLPPYFDPVVTASSAAPKPSPEGALRICAAWKREPQELLFVGDSSHDKEAAASAGMPFAAFSGDGLHGDIVVQDFSTLRSVLAPALTTREGSCHSKFMLENS